MALNINTNITNNLDGYLLDAKNVKGGFVVVEDWSDVESLPSSTKVTGSLIYVVGDTLGGGANVGFYQCDAIGNWQKRVLGGSGIYQFVSESANDIDYSQTYIYTLTSSQQTQIGSDFARLVDADTTTLPMFIFAFNDINLLIAMSNLAMVTNGILSHTIIEQNNTQYIVNINIALDYSTITLSFSELQAGSGGGGTEGSSEKIYTYKMEWDAVNVGVGQTNILTFSVNENTIKGLPSVYQSVIDASDLVSAWNTIKAGVSGGSQDAFIQAMIFITMLSSFTFDKSLIEFDDNIDGSMKNITAITAMLGNDQTLEFSYNNGSNNVQNYSMALNDFFASTMTLLGSVGGASGGSGGEGVTKTIHEYTVDQHIDYTITDGGFDYSIDVSPEYKVFIDGDEAEIVKNINYVILYINEQLSVIPGFTPFADITNFADYPSKATEIQTYLRTLYGQSILDDYSYASMMLFVCEAPLVYIDETLLPNASDSDVLAQIMVESFDNIYNNKYKIKSGVKVGGFDSNCYMTTLADGLEYRGTIFGPAIVFDKNASNTFGHVFQIDALPTAFTPATERVFGIVCRGDAPALTFSYNETTETYGGGSSEGTGGSGKLYVYDFTLDTYDSNGKVVANSGKQFQIGIYESNFERLKALTSGTAMALSSPQDVVTLINSLSETTTSSDFDNVNRIAQLIALCDIKSAVEEILNDTLYKPINATILLAPLIYYDGDIDYQYISLTTVESDIDVAYGLNANNSCTLTEYGTSGSGGGSATQKVYAFSLKTSTDGNAISTNNYVEMVAKISEDAFNNEFLPYMNQVGQQLAQQQGITWTNINNVNDFVTFENTYHSTYGMVCMATLVEYCLKDNNIVYATLEDYSGGDGFYLFMASSVGHSALMNGLAVNVYSVMNDPYQYAKEWFTNNSGESTYYLDFSGNAISSLTYTEEQVAGGGSGSGTTTKKWYEYKLTEGSSSLITHSYIVAKISEEQQNELFTQLSTALSQTISTPQDLIDIYNQLKADDLSNSQTIYQQLVQVWMMLWIYSAQEFRTIYTSAGFGKIPVNLLDISSTFQDTASGNLDGDKITFDANSILSITETTETIGGGSGSSQPTEPYTQLANDTPMSSSTVTVTVNDITNYDFVQIGVCNGTHWLWQTAKRSKLSSEALLFQFGNDIIEIGISGTSVSIIPTNATIYEYDIYGVN